MRTQKKFVITCGRAPSLGTASTQSTRTSHSAGSCVIQLGACRAHAPRFNLLFVVTGYTFGSQNRGPGLLKEQSGHGQVVTAEAACGLELITIPICF